MIVEPALLAYIIASSLSKPEVLPIVYVPLDQSAKILGALETAGRVYSLLKKLNETVEKISKECENKHGFSKFKCVIDKLPPII